jgi:hypothetical protein
MALIYTRYDARVLPLIQSRRLVVAWVLAGVSLLAGYFAYQNLLGMLAGKFVRFDLPMVSWPGRIQFVAFMACVVVSGEFVWAGLREAQKESKR